MIEFQITGMDKLAANFSRYPLISRPLVAKGINALLAELHKNANDENFMFKTPRALRTGRLASSFAEGIELATPSTMQGRIGPRVNYAIFVHEGTSRIQPNPFMQRILKVSEPKGEEYFKSVAQQIAENLVRV